MNLLKLRGVLVVAVALGVVGCGGTSMQLVIKECDRVSSFTNYVDCIKTRYDKEGASPNSAAARKFYAILDSLAQLHATNRISTAEAKDVAYQAYLNIAQEDEERRSAAFLGAMGALANMPQGQVQPSLLSAPVQTRCTRSGNSVNCTSY